MAESTDHWKKLITEQGREILLPGVAARVDELLDSDLDYFEGSAGFIYDGRPLEKQLPLASALVRHWQEGETTPSLAAMCIFAVSHAKLKLSPEMMRALMTAALLGEKESTLPYHNNDHYKKVLFQIIRLTQNDRTLNPEQIAMLMIAACVHDYGHDGKGNIVNGIHRPGRSEIESYNAVAPHLRKAGLNDAQLRDLKIMLLATDISESEDNPSYASEVKSISHYHYDKKRELVLTHKDLELLYARPDLTQSCLLLHEADIATSVGLSYDVTKHETVLFTQESGDENPSPGYVLSFVDKVCENEFTSEPGQRLYGANMKAIVAALQVDKDKGNKKFEIAGAEPTPRSDATSAPN